VAIVYFDSSAFVKLLVEEDGTDLVAQLWDGCDAALSSRLAYPEVRAALAAAHRNNTLDATGLEGALQIWEEFWSATRPVEFRTEIERHAGELAQLHSLRGADAVHLASALTVPKLELVVAVWDRRLHAGAHAEGLATAPATI
jgi:uncharacterized protein